MDAKQLKAKLQGNAIIRAALETGDIRLIYKRQPSLSDDLLFGTWTVEVLLVDPDVQPLVVSALEREGFEVTAKGDKLLAEFTFPITPAERRAMEQQQQQRKDAAREKQHQGELNELHAAIDELKADFAVQLQQLQDEMYLQGLMPGRGKTEKGERGAKGKDGRDGKDLEASEVELQDLADVSKIPPAQGQVLMWSELAQEWQPKRVASGITSISSGGGGGNSGGGGPDQGDGCCPENPGPGGPGDDLNTGWMPKWWYETAEGHWMPRTGMQNIGSADMPVKELFVSSGSIIMDGHTVALGEKNGEQRLTYDGKVLAYETYTDDGDAVQPIGDAPRDGYHYVRYMGTWVRLEDLLQQLGLTDTVDGGLWSEIVCSGTFKADAGNFQTGQADGVNETADGGNWSTGEIEDDWNQALDGGNLN